MSTTSGNWAAVATTTAYPMLDLLLLLIVVMTLAAYGWHPPFGMWLLTAGLAAFVLADVAYLIETAHGTYVSGKLTDGVWILATVVMSLAPGWRESDRSWRMPSWALLGIPIASSLAAMGVLAVDHYSRLHPIAIGLAMATVVVALIRLVVTFREVASLSHSHRLALTDELTGLANRRALYEEPLRAVTRTRSRSSACCCSTSTASRRSTTASGTTPVTRCSRTLRAGCRRATCRRDT